MALLNWVERTILNRINIKKGIKITKENLSFSFHDLDGNGYYKLPKGLEIPICRVAKVQDYLMWLYKGVTKDEYMKALEYAKQGLEGGIKDGKGLAKIGFILSELEERANMVIHDELFYNIIAAQIIRHDENINEFNNAIHMEKVATFKELDKLDDCFFLNIQEYLISLGLSNITKSQYDNLMNVSVQIRKSMEKMIATLQEK